MTDKDKDKDKDSKGFLNNTNISQLNAGLFLFYLALLGNYTGDLLPPDLMKFINSSRITQHLISFIMLLFTINLYSSSKLYKILLYTFLLWLWYLFTSKQHLYVSIVIILLLILSYSLYLMSKNIDDDKTLSESVKTHRKKIYTQIQNVCFIVIIIVACIGGYRYFIEHYRQYGKYDKNFLDFLIKYLLMGKGKKA